MKRRITLLSFFVASVLFVSINLQTDVLFDGGGYVCGYGFPLTWQARSVIFSGYPITADILFMLVDFAFYWAIGLGLAVVTIRTTKVVILHRYTLITFGVLALLSWLFVGGLFLGDSSVVGPGYYYGADATRGEHSLAIGLNYQATCHKEP